MNAKDYVLVAMFDSRATAEAAQKDLRAAGMTDVSLSDAAPATGATATGVKAEKGFWERLKEFFGAEEDYSIYTEGSRRGATVLTVECDEPCDEAVAILQRHGAVDIDERAQAWGIAGTTGGAGAGTTKARTGKAAKGKTTKAGKTEQTIPVTEERLKVGKLAQQRGGVRVISRVTETPVQEQVTLRDERVNVERRKVDRPAGADAFKEGVVEATELHEEPVVQKEARVVEEVVISKESGEHTETIEDTVRKIQVDVQDLEVDFRRDFDERYAKTGATYEQYRPAYDYGRRLATSEKGSWTEIEQRARQAYEQQSPGAWNTYGEAVRRGYERTLARR